MSNYEAKVTVTGEDKASPVVDSATKNILNQYRQMRQEIRATTAEFALQNQTLVATQGVFRSVGSIASGLTNIFTQYQTMQIRGIDAQNRLLLAQMHYNQVLAEQGPGTNEAIAAGIELQDAQRGVAQAAQDSTLGFIGMGFSLAGTVSQIITAIPRVQEFIKVLQRAQTEAQVTNALSTAAGGGVGGGSLGGTGKGGKIGAGLAGIAGLGIAGAGFMSSQAMSSTPLDFNSKLLSVGEQAGGGALTGAAIGSIVPGIGTVIGGVAGAAVGGVAGIISNFGDDIKNFFSGKSGSGNQPGTVEHVVTVKIENSTDNRISATEKSMNIEQVMTSGN